MKTKKITGKAWALAAAALLLAGAASCDKEAAEPATGDGKPVELIFPDAPPVWTAPDGTRTIDLGHGVTEWTEGDKIYCSFNFENTYKKAIYTYTNGAWESQDIVLWPSGKTLTLWATYIGGYGAGDEVVNVDVLASVTDVATAGPVTMDPFKHRTTRLEFKNVPDGKTVWLKGSGFYDYAILDDIYSLLSSPNSGVIEVAANYYVGIRGTDAASCMFGIFDSEPTGNEPEGWYSLGTENQTGGTPSQNINYYNGKWLTLDLASLGIVRPGDPSTGFVDAETQRFLDWADAARANANVAETSYTLKGDIDLSLCGYWVPFDLASGKTFDGAGYTIRGLKVDQTVTGDAYDAGLFAYNYGTIRNLTVEGTVVGHHSSGGAGNDAGGMAGTNGRSGSIVNCRFRGSVQGKNDVGGIVGYNIGLVAGCSYRGAEVKATSEDAGGIVGMNGSSFGDKGIVAGCWSEAENIDKGSGTYAVAGGVAGYQNANSYVYGSYYLTGSAVNGIGYDENSGNAPSDIGCTQFDGVMTYPDVAVLNAGLDEARAAGAAIPAGMRWVKHPTAPYPFVYNP